MLKINNKVTVSEVFGPTIQGEGLFVGELTVFVRTFGCDSYCTMCDSMHAVDKKHPLAIRSRKDEKWIYEEINKLDPTKEMSVTISGGNPLLWDLYNLVERLVYGDHRDVRVETQGTKWQDWIKMCSVTLSPKGPGMNDTKKGVMDPFKVVQFIQRFSSLPMDKKGTLILKIVVFDDLDLDYAEELILYMKRHLHVGSTPVPPVYLSVGNDLPNTDKPHPDLTTELLRESLLVDYNNLIIKVLERSNLFKTRIFPQQHVLLWGNELGR